MSDRDRLCVFLLGACGTWNAGSAMGSGDGEAAFLALAAFAAISGLANAKPAAPSGETAGR